MMMVLQHSSLIYLALKIITCQCRDFLTELCCNILFQCFYCLYLFFILKLAIFNIPGVIYIDEALLENLETEEAMLISGM